MRRAIHVSCDAIFTASPEMGSRHHQMVVSSIDKRPERASTRTQELVRADVQARFKPSDLMARDRYGICPSGQVYESPRRSRYCSRAGIGSAASFNFPPLNEAKGVSATSTSVPAARPFDRPAQSSPFPRPAPDRDGRHVRRVNNGGRPCDQMATSRLPEDGHGAGRIR